MGDTHHGDGWLRRIHSRAVPTLPSAKPAGSSMVPAATESSPLRLVDDGAGYPNDCGGAGGP
jgi:hypothetical protein